MLSLSVGNAAVFLLGGFAKDTDREPPLAVFMRSGDVILMGGDSRLRYHAVPRVLASSVPLALRELLADEGEAGRSGWVARGIAALLGVRRALAHDARLNINVRQVPLLPMVTSC